MPVQGTDSVSVADPLFVGGVFPHFQRSLSLFRPVGFGVQKQAVLAVVIGWVPLVILIVAESARGHWSLLSSFVSDFAVHGRSLIAAPLLILTELVCSENLGKIVKHFTKADLIEERDRPRFDSLLVSTKALINSSAAEIVAIVAAYVIVLVVMVQVPLDFVPAWYSLEDHPDHIRSWAWWWHTLVSLPLLLVLFFGWLWRILLWGRMLFGISRMHLRLLAAHPDRAAGLRFLSSGLFGFAPLAFTLGVIVASAMANRVLYQGASIYSLKKPVGGLIVAVLILFVGPLLVFPFKLYREKVDGIFRYGRLAQDVGGEFERKWLAGYKRSGSPLESPDFSAVNDLYQIVTNVHGMIMVPFEFKYVLGLVIVTLIPFIPVALMTVPLRVILQELAALLL